MTDADSGKADASRLVRALVRRSWKGTLATISRVGGHPYASLVAVATDADGSPLLLLSGLAEHTKNILADQRVSLLIDGTEPGRVALTGARVTLVGLIGASSSQNVRARYLRRHPDAAGFIDFADFNLYRLEVEWAHLVAGFGRIVRLSAGDVVLDTANAADLVAAESGILDHMNEDHADALTLMATAARRHEGRPTTETAWRMIGCDREGIDLTDGTEALRLTFSKLISTPSEVRDELVRMTHAARQPPRS